MRYLISVTEAYGLTRRNVNIDRGNDEFTSFPAEIGNPVYDSFLESQSLTDAEVQAMTPEPWPPAEVII